jgi:hypothetical protein
MIEDERETVVGDTRIDAMLEAKRADPRADHTGVAAHNLAAAMGEDGAGRPSSWHQRSCLAIGACPISLWSRRRTIDLTTVAPSPI